MLTSESRQAKDGLNTFIEVGGDSEGDVIDYDQRSAVEMVDGGVGCQASLPSTPEPDELSPACLDETNSL